MRLRISYETVIVENTNNYERMRPSRYDHNDCIDLLNFSLALLSFSFYIQNCVIYVTQSLPQIATNVL